MFRRFSVCTKASVNYARRNRLLLFQLRQFYPGHNSQKATHSMLFAQGFLFIESIATKWLIHRENTPPNWNWNLPLRSLSEQRCSCLILSFDTFSELYEYLLLFILVFRRHFIIVCSLSESLANATVHATIRVASMCRARATRSYRTKNGRKRTRSGHTST